ncbi:MAG: hypothetical protein PHW37_05065 [Acholeplasmataceae bacterium]|nr:hypothetical protein [Acholeplasmataceae bacterium]
MIIDHRTKNIQNRLILSDILKMNPTYSGVNDVHHSLFMAYQTCGEVL